MSYDLAARLSADDAAFEQAYKQCSNADTTVTICSPTDQTVAYQGQWVQLVWNSNHPEFVQAGQIDVRVFRNGTTDDAQPTLVYTKNAVQNPTKNQQPAGSMGVKVEDSWFADNEWKGSNITNSFYVTIAPGGGSPETQPAFSAVQTAPVSLISCTTSPCTAYAESSVPVGAIAGPIVGGLALLTGLGTWWLLRRRRAAAAEEAIKVTLGADTSSDTRSIVSKVDEKAEVRKSARV
ncbi:unnamed protein product [Peniophora sp. CBMAI 1063]|nr:unnamed protein product [Peniophora sp. CBMAI 1063]